MRDEETTFSEEQAITGSAISTNIIDLKAARTMGTGARPLFVVLKVTTAFTDSSDNSSATVILQTDSIEAFNSATNSQTLGTIATNAAIGDGFVMSIGPNAANERYLGVYYEVAGGNFTTGKVTTFITPDPDLYTARAKGYTGPTFA